MSSAGDHYLDGLPADLADELQAANQEGLQSIAEYLGGEAAVAFLGAGVSAPLYPLWTDVIEQLVVAAEERGLSPERALTYRRRAATQPDAVVELVGQYLGPATYQSVLREVFRVRSDADSGRSWTQTQELVCRCSFRAVVTTNYDRGVVDARTRVRPGVADTGFTVWSDELALDRWRTGEAFRSKDELPILYAHGHHNQPEDMVLAAADYRRAYAGALSKVFERMIDSWHLVWLGFSFADHRIASVLREVTERRMLRTRPRARPRHVVVMAYDPKDGGDPTTLVELARIDYHARLVLYPAPGGDHSALHRLLDSFTDPRFPAAPALADRGPGIADVRPVVPVPRRSVRRTSTGKLPVHWVHGTESAKSFLGRAEELARLNRWAADPGVRLIAVSAWGGAGKTALVTHWLDRANGAAHRPGIRGVFGWSFYTNPNADAWARTLIDWASRTYRLDLGRGTLAQRVIRLLSEVPLALVLDGLEVVQESPASDGYGRLMDGLLREVLTTVCRLPMASLVTLTSRFPFADLAGFDGTAARMLEVPPFTPAEGAAMLAAAGAAAVPEQRRRELVAEVDGHALALSAMAAVLAGNPDTTTAADLLAHMTSASGAKVVRVLAFYADQLSPMQRSLVAAVSLFTRTVNAAQLRAVAERSDFAGHLLDGLTPARLRKLAEGPLSGLLAVHPDGSVSAHPLVRTAFRALALGAASVAADVSLTDSPAGPVTTREHALRVVEVIEGLLEAGQWAAADNMYQARTRNQNGSVWQSLPAARLGQRAATAFIGSPARRQGCALHLPATRLAFYLNEAGLLAMLAGDLPIGADHLDQAISYRRSRQSKNLSIGLQNRAGCLAYLGQVEDARRMADEAAEAAHAAGDSKAMVFSQACLGWIADLLGEAPAADAYFRDANRLERRRGFDDYFTVRNLHSVWGVWWASFLARTGREYAARRLTRDNLVICQRNRWNEDVARCEVLLARLELADRRPSGASTLLTSAVTLLRAGDYLVELADALTVMGEYARLTGDLDGADGHVEEALSIAVPRGLLGVHAAALALRAQVAADRFVERHDPADLRRGRDAADAAARLSTEPRELPWLQLEAVNAHACLDRAERTDRGWALQTRVLHARLVPSGLDPNPFDDPE